MIKYIVLFSLLIGSLFFSCTPLPPAKEKKIEISESVIEKENYAIALHGGAGTIPVSYTHLTLPTTPYV